MKCDWSKEDKSCSISVNPCNPDKVEKQPIWAALANLPCEDAAAQNMVQAGADVTEGSTGQLDAALSPIEGDYADACTEPFGCMCPVNVHWHLGAEHRNEGSFDIDGAQWMADNWQNKAGNHRSLSDDIEPGNFCPGYDPQDPKYTTEYKWKYCQDMHVGLTYEIHWPHSNLGYCGTKWQYQSHFMDGVLCKANEANLDPSDAVAAVFTSKVALIGVQAQVFTVVNDDAYDYPDWDPITGWNKALASDVAVYQGSTTGQKDGNLDCRGTGGAVTWQVDRDCHLISAKAFDELCKAMLSQNDDMSSDTHAHNARETTAPEITTNVAMPAGWDPERQ